MTERWWLYGALGGYVVAFVLGLGRRSPARLLAAVALVPHAVAIAMRWRDLDHGPYLGLHDSLSSNLWLHLLLFLLLMRAVPALRAATVPALGFGAVFAAWLVLVPATPVDVPPTYDTAWFYVHTLASKLGLSLLFAAAAAALTGGAAAGAGRKLLPAAFLCHTLLLFSGGSWAYLAWGAYWDWNALEVSALLTWFAFGLYFHRDFLGAWAERAAPWFVAAIFALAVLAFYGVPFLSRVSHQGLV